LRSLGAVCLNELHSWAFRIQHTLRSGLRISGENSLMQDESGYIRRRDFLRWSAAGAAAAGLDVLLNAHAPAQQVAAASEGTRTAPEHPVVLHSDLVEVALDADDGLPYQYRYKPTGATLRGEDYGQKISVTICNFESWDFFAVTATAEPAQPPAATAAHQADFNFTVKEGPEKYATFRLHYQLRGASLFITLDTIGEMPGFQLIDAAMPHLATVREEDPGAWLVYGDSGGKFISLAEAVPGTLPANRFWGRIHSTMPITMVGTAHMLCLQETTAYMDTTNVAVTGGKGSRRATIGSGRAHRVNGSKCYDMNLGNGAPRICGSRGTPNLMIDDTPSARLDFLPVTGDPRDAWLAAGKMVRERMPKIPKTLYNDRYIYGVFCDLPNRPAPPSTFQQCEKLISDVAKLTDHAPQIVHLWGWQFRGKDTGYPAVNVVDERIGGYEGMMRLMAQGAKLNALITLSDNYDDAYRSSPAWNPNMMAWRPDGQLWKSRAWTGEASYIQGLAKYMENGPGVERVRYTCQHYKLPGTTHIDVLSYFSIRNDWDRRYPASGIRNLVHGRFRILQEFAKHGVDVTSEALRYPMIGRISAFWYAQPSDSAPLGGYSIPLLQLVYGKSAIWGLGSGMRNNGFELRAQNLFWGANLHAIMSYETDRKQITDMYYLIMVPWLHLHEREVRAFVRDGKRTSTAYEGDTRVEIDWGGQTYSVILEGEEVANQDAVFCPLDANRICFYSTRAQQLTAAWPEDWSHSAATAVTLSVGKREPAKFNVKDGRITVEVAAQQPVILYRTRAQARV
jgi:hypothetical protein